MTTYNVSSGATVSALALTSGSDLFVRDGGSAVGITVESGSYELVMSGGAAVETTVAGGGTLILLPGAKSDITESDGNVISTDAIVFVTTDSVLTDQSPLASSTAASGTTEYVLAGASSENSLVTGGIMNIYSEGLASGTILTSGGAVNVAASGTVFDSLVASGTGQYVAGHAYDTTIDGGTEYIDANGSSVSGTANDGGTQFVYSGGSTLDFQANSGGVQQVTTGALASSTTIASGGYQILSGGDSQVTVVNSGGYQLVSSGGIALGTTINDGGVAFIYSGGTASGTTVETGGILIVLPGATALNTANSGGDVISTGVITVLDAGTSPTLTILSNNTVTSSEITYVLAGGALAGVTNSGTVELYSGGAENGTIDPSSASTDIIHAGGVATSGIVTGGGVLEVLGTAIGTTLGVGGADDLFAGGITSFTTVNSGGTEYVSSGGTAIGTIVDRGGRELIASGGAASATDARAGGIAIVAPGGFASGFSLNSGGVEFVFSAAAALSTSVASGGTLIVLPGADVDGTASVAGAAIVSAGIAELNQAEFVTYIGSTLDGATVGSGDTAYILPEGTASSSLITAGGTINVYSGGIAADTTISGGVANILSGGEASRTILAAGFQILTVSSGGAATGTVINSGGVENILSGGTATSAAINGGATEYVFSGATTTGSFVYSGGAEYLYGGGIASNLTLAIGGLIDASALTYDGNGSATLASNDQLTVTEAGTSLKLQLVGNYTGGDFTVAPDGSGGTEIGYVPCYCRGTWILTDRGEIAVEDLAIGDRLITAGGAKQPILWIGRRAYNGRFIAGDRDVLPILFKRGSLGEGIPKRDLYVSPLHAFFLDGMLIPAWVLENGASIVQLETVEAVEYFHLELAAHEVILAEGAAAESFVDDGGRAMFQNAAEHHTLYPDASRRAPKYCAPRVDYGKPVEKVWVRLAKRAAALRRAPLVAEPAARVVSLLIPAGTGSVRIDQTISRGLPAGVVLDGLRLDPASMRRDGSLDIDPPEKDVWCHIEVAAAGSPD